MVESNKMAERYERERVLLGQLDKLKFSARHSPDCPQRPPGPGHEPQQTFSREKEIATFDEYARPTLAEIVDEAALRGYDTSDLTRITVTTERDGDDGCRIRADWNFSVPNDRYGDEMKVYASRCALHETAFDVYLGMLDRYVAALLFDHERRERSHALDHERQLAEHRSHHYEMAAPTPPAPLAPAKPAQKAARPTKPAPRKLTAKQTGLAKLKKAGLTAAEKKALGIRR